MDDKNDNEDGRAPLEYLPGAPESLVTPLLTTTVYTVHSRLRLSDDWTMIPTAGASVNTS